MDNTLNNIEDTDIEYLIVVKKMEDILYEVTDDDTERLIYESIIDGIETSAAVAIRAGKVAQLPSIGCLRKNPIRQVVKNNYNNFKIARKYMTKQQYQDHVREVIIDAKETFAKQDAQKLIDKRIRSRNKKQYDLLYTTLGKAHAEMFIFSITALREVPFDIEFQEHYDKLNGL